MQQATWRKRGAVGREGSLREGERKCDSEGEKRGERAAMSMSSPVEVES